MKILVTPTSFRKPQNDKARKILENFADEIVYNDLGVPLSGEAILTRLDGVVGYIAGVDYITADVIAAMPDCVKVISRYGTGVDRVDLAACRQKGIIVTNTPGANATAVCELAFGLMLACARNIPMLHASVCKGEWPRVNGRELAGKTLGIVGMGAIGKKLAIRALAFDMKAVTYDPWLDMEFANTHGIVAMQIDELLRIADIVSLHVPLTEQTKYMINAERISSMKRGAILINTARGELINEAAAADAVRCGQLRGLGLDVFDQEPLVDSPLKNLPNVVLTPHIGSHTDEAVTNMGVMAVENAIDVINGMPCKNIVK